MYSWITATSFESPFCERCQTTFATKFPAPKISAMKIIEELEVIELEITKAVPIGLIVNEAITNSLKHAFHQGHQNPSIKIKMQLIFDRIQICIMDNGSGFTDTSNRKETALGLSLIESLSDQIDAQVVFKNEDGACVSLVFPT